MNTKPVVILSAALMAAPLGVMAADDDVTIRVMQQNENSEQAVLHRIELPERAMDKASEQATEQAPEHASEEGQQLNREQVRNRNRVREGEPEYQQQDADEEREDRVNESLQERQEAHQVMEQHENAPEDIDIPGPGHQGPF